jgi:hypothetical protein
MLRPLRHGAFRPRQQLLRGKYMARDCQQNCMAVRAGRRIVAGRSASARRRERRSQNRETAFLFRKTGKNHDKKVKTDER